MIKHIKAPTGVSILEELQTFELELQFKSAMRAKLQVLIRILVQDLTVETLTLEKFTWFFRPLLEGTADREERMIRAHMNPTLRDYDTAVKLMDQQKFIRIPLGLVGSGRQIIHTANAWREVYDRLSIKTSASQTENEDFDSEYDDELIQQLRQQDELERYFAEED